MLRGLVAVLLAVAACADPGGATVSAGRETSQLGELEGETLKTEEHIEQFLKAKDLKVPKEVITFLSKKVQSEVEESKRQLKSACTTFMKGTGGETKKGKAKGKASRLQTADCTRKEATTNTAR